MPNTPNSIWKDYEVSFGNVAEADYSIVDGDDEVLFAGRAVRRPDQSYLTVRINDVCADQLFSTHYGPSGTASRADHIWGKFWVLDSGGNTVEAVEFIKDWSFDYDHDPTVLAAPINGRVSYMQSLYMSYWNPNNANVQVTLRYANGTTGSITVNQTGGWVQILQLFMDDYANLAAVTVNGITYTVVPSCARYALLYVNAYGGWDTLLMEGNHLLTDGYERRTMRQAYDNRAAQNRGTVEYVNEITRHWTLRTGWLTDDQASRMFHLLGSTDVYLYDLLEGRQLPVVITDTACEYKTFRGSGGKMVAYTVDVDLATNIVRR